jgi:putative membrane protein
VREYRGRAEIRDPLQGPELAPKRFRMMNYRNFNVSTASRVLLLSAASLAVSSAIQAQTPGGTPDPARAAVERADAVAREAFEEGQITDPTVFVKSAALGGLTEIELAKLAQSKSENAGIKGFAARVLKDHEALHRELAAVAKRKRLDVPSSLVYQDEQLVSEGAEKSASEFDAWYAELMIAEHQKALALFQAAAKMEDTDLAAFAKKALPVLSTHQKMATDLAGR